MNDLVLGMLGAFIIIVIGWAITWFHIIRENERAIVVTFGNPGRVVESGLVLVLWPFQYLRRFAMTMNEIELKKAHIVTAEKDGSRQVQLEAEGVIQFSWPDYKSDPTGELLRMALRTVSNPENIQEVGDLIDESARDAIRTAGGDSSWKEIVRDRKNFADKILNNLYDEESDLFRRIGIPREKVKVVVTNIPLPPSLAEAITLPEIERLKAEGKAHEAEGEKVMIKKKGEAEAEVRKIIFDAIGKDPDRLVLEQLLTLREMAKGTSNTIIVPAEVASVLANVGRIVNPTKMEQVLGSTGVSAELVQRIMEELKTIISKK